MVTFLEYVKNAEKALYFNLGKMKNGSNGKDYNSTTRKHQGITNKEYKPLNLPPGVYMGSRLQNLLRKTHLKISPGKTKRVSNSKVTVTFSQDGTQATVKHGL
jgi:hypothetical protein